MPMYCDINTSYMHIHIPISVQRYPLKKVHTNVLYCIYLKDIMIHTRYFLNSIQVFC